MKENTPTQLSGDALPTSQTSSARLYFNHGIVVSVPLTCGLRTSAHITGRPLLISHLMRDHCDDHRNNHESPPSNQSHHRCSPFGSGFAILSL
ncbi:hypothetical protein U1Q18_040098 [Sarracenia purpurea var. burkii]